MSKRLTNIVIIAAASMWALTGCDNSADTANKNSDAAVTMADAAAANTVDWSAMASGEQPADLANYQYPFALDSQNVRDYAEYFKVDNATAQHNLTVSMASNEALSKALDQLSESYVSHQLTDDKDMTLIIHTTPDVAASSYDYVLAGDFAKGLVLPIVIQPDGKKGDVKGHEEMAE
ncbi:hypothetical protein [Psychrobacter sp. DAB_AL62B]|uniref:hypothetical protein n=1 Tax=Psychrobacter sp. DAB_AL62B TaxID=1028420 RepID=UPI002380E5AB|nr:hypothetical protein [Psychrobacter sp. DAB_AL62B]MDE4454577.1 hypothetical protein [Psychrobacter sp. DAB_AL62B]